jgi:hypothetical protein
MTYESAARHEPFVEQGPKRIDIWDIACRNDDFVLAAKHEDDYAIGSFNTRDVFP